LSYSRSPEPTLDIELREEGYIEYYLDYNDNFNFKEGMGNDKDIIDVINNFLILK
jgi:hypothetical protein